MTSRLSAYVTSTTNNKTFNQYNLTGTLWIVIDSSQGSAKSAYKDETANKLNVLSYEACFTQKKSVRMSNNTSYKQRRTNYEVED